MAGKIKEISAKDFKREVIEGGKVVVDFYSTECPPCEALASKYESLSEIYGNDITFIKIFRQENRELAEELEVTGSPTVLFFSDGKKTGDVLTGGIKRSSIVANLDKMLPAERVSEIKKSVEKRETRCKVLILGGGPAGLTAGLYLSQAHIDTILVDVALPGGYVSTTHLVSNYPGFIEPVQGFMLAHYMGEQAKAAGVQFRSAVEVTEVNLKEKSLLVDGIEKIKAEKIIIATGSSPRPLNLPGEKEYGGQGISYCATCDAKYFDGKEVIVIGGGNSAIEEALFISKFAGKITVIHQFDHLQANKLAQQKAFADEKINFLFEHEPREFIRHGAMDMEVIVENLKTKERKGIKAAGIFVFVGFIPNIDAFRDQLELDQWGNVKGNEDMRTSLKDIFVVGDVKNKSYRQITTAVSDGTIAAMTISKELA